MKNIEFYIIYVFSQMEKKGVKSIWVGYSDLDVEMYKHLGFNITFGKLLAWNNDQRSKNEDK